MNRFSAIAAGIVAKQINGIASVRKLADIAGGFIGPSVAFDHPFAAVLFDKLSGFGGGTEGVRGNRIQAVRGKYLLGMFAVIFQQIAACTAADYRITLDAQIIGKLSEAVVVTNDQPPPPAFPTQSRPLSKQEVFSITPSRIRTQAGLPTCARTS
jgi:hypothetical protein